MARTADFPGPSTPVDGRQVVTTAGTRVALSTTEVWCHEVDVTAETDNTGVIALGGATVVAALATRRGTPLNPGDTETLHNVDLSQVFIDSTVSTDGVTWTAVT